MTEIAIALTISGLLFIYAIWQIHYNQRRAKVLKRFNEVLGSRNSNLPVMTPAEINEMHATRWDGD